MGDSLLKIKNLFVKYANLKIDELTIKRGLLTVIIGTNGAGKTTLLNELAARSESIFFNGRSLKNFSYQELARQRAVLSQQQKIAFDLSVKALIELGREPYRDLYAEKFNKEVCKWALNVMELGDLEGRNCRLLSGGEQQRSHIARVLAQLMPEINADLSEKWLLLDEPTNHLDIRHQYQLFRQLKNLQKQGLTIIAVLHDPIMAMNLADEIILLKNGNLFAVHSRESLLRSQDLSKLYDVYLRCNLCAESGKAYLMEID